MGISQGNQAGAWIYPTLLNGWQNYDGAAPSGRALRYRYIGGHTLQVIGTIKNTSGTQPTTTIFSLPSGNPTPPIPVYPIQRVFNNTGAGVAETCFNGANYNVSAWMGGSADYVHICTFIPIGS